MITLGADPSLTGFGWCVHNSSVVGPSRVLAKGQISTSARQVIYWRYLYIRDALKEVLDAFPEVEAVGVESPPFGESYSEGLYGLFLYVNEVLFQRRLDTVYFDPLRVKLLAKMDSSVRRGTMDKGSMVDAAKQDTSIRKWNHNEADAYIISRSAARFWNFYAGRLRIEDLTPSEQQVFAKPKNGVIHKKNDRFYLFSELRLEDVYPKVSLDIVR